VVEIKKNGQVTKDKRLTSWLIVLRPMIVF